MPMHARERLLQERDERELRYGLEQDPRDELEDEFGLADRIADQASLPAGDPGCRAAARTLLGHDDGPPRPPIPEPQRLAGGANGAVGAQPGRGPRLPDMPGPASAAQDAAPRPGSDELAPRDDSMRAARRDPSARDPEGVHGRALSRQRCARINAAAAALERHAGHDRDPLALLLAAAELRSIAAHPDTTGPAESAAADPQRLREALVRIADAESGIWGTIARDALDGGAATPAATATGDASARR